MYGFRVNHDICMRVIVSCLEDKVKKCVTYADTFSFFLNIRWLIGFKNNPQSLELLDMVG